MSVTRRGKLAVGAVGLLVFGTLGYFTLFPEQAPAVIRTAMDRMGLAHASAPAPPPATCPLTGTNAPGVRSHLARRSRSRSRTIRSLGRRPG